MKATCYFFSVITISLILASCQKELSVQGGTTPTPPPPTTVIDSNYIDTVYAFETQNTITANTEYFAYKYDSGKRVVSVNWEGGNYLSPYSDSGRMTYFYHGTDSVPYLSFMTATWNGMLVFDTTKTYYTYDNMGRLVKDSSYYGERDISPTPYYRVRHMISTYSYNAGKVVGQSADLAIIEPNPISYPTTYNIDTAILSNQNPISSVDYVSYINNTSFSKYYETVISYDNNPSPYYKLNISKSFTPIPGDGAAVWFLYYTGKNNYTSYITIHTGSTGTETFNNIYLNNGYIKKTSFPAQNNPANKDGYIYVYKTM